MAGDEGTGDVLVLKLRVGSGGASGGGRTWLFPSFLFHSHLSRKCGDDNDDDSLSTGCSWTCLDGDPSFTVNLASTLLMIVSLTMSLCYVLTVSILVQPFSSWYLWVIWL
ncbi:hypothetical protein EDD15DRAFT_2201240 [Pisolithus albus]|nr:hypothetical protein EDD15DRAFT_2201240 [Pisolithus albus]